MNCATNSSYPVPDGLPLILGHRGASAVRPENSLAAFIEARRQGADGVELDVRRSADGAVVVVHDAVLHGRPVSELTVAELPPGTALLDAALDACEGLLVNIEIKNMPHEPGWDATESLAREVAALVDGGDHRIVVSAFTMASIDAVKQSQPGVETAWLTSSRFDAAIAATLAADHGHDGLHPQHGTVDAAVVATCREIGLSIRTWTVDEPPELLRLAALGVNAVITNLPDVAIATLRPAPSGS